MVVAIFGESCTGKSTVADALKQRLSAEVYSGRDYLRFDKAEAQAQAKFKAFLAENATGGKAVVYVISEPEHLALLPAGCVRVLATADLDTIKSRFAQRTGGRLPAPVAAMLERRHGLFDHEPHDVQIASGRDSIEELCDEILALIR